MKYSAIISVVLWSLIITAQCADTRVSINIPSKKSTIQPCRMVQALAGLGFAGFGVSEAEYLIKYLRESRLAQSDEPGVSALILRSYIGSLTLLALAVGGSAALIRQAWRNRTVPVTVPLENESPHERMKVAKNIGKSVLGAGLVAFSGYWLLSSFNHVRSGTCPAPRWSCLLRHHAQTAVLTGVIAYGCKIGIRAAMRLKKHFSHKKESPVTA